jgi:lysozyme
MTQPTCIDISRYQPSVDFEELAAGGTLAVIIKATEGWSIVDSSFAGHYADALAAGLAVATYHYLHHGYIQQQCDLYLGTVEPRPGERVCIDFEDAACTLDDLRAMVQAIAAADPSLQITVYSGHLIKDLLGSTKDATLAATSLWIAQYTSAASPSWPTGTWPTWSLWQYTDNASVAGISGAVDGSRFNGPDANLIAWIGPAPQPAPPPVAAATVTIDISADQPITLIVNGQTLDIS